MKLLASALVKLLMGLALLGAMLFWPAGTWNYPNGWLFLAVLFFPMLMVGAVMLVKSPVLLEKRLHAKEKEQAQKGVLAVAALMFPLGFVLSGLDFRYGWSQVPLWCVITAAVLFLAGYGMYAEVLRENAYLSRTVEVQEGQRVIDTGLYGVVRHPMYLATILMFLPMPLILGSLWGLLPMAIYPLLMVVRIGNEEKVLCEELDGYDAYRQKVKYRLIPFIW